jgi:cathepsin L
MAALLVPMLLAPAAATTTRWHQLNDYNFAKWQAEFGKSYSSAAERDLREAIFTAKLESIRAHNDNPAHRYKRGVNHMTDRSAAELASLNGLDRGLLFAKKAAEPEAAEPVRTLPLPPSQDWRRVGAVTPVKDQGACGSCWSFASAETLESHWFLKTGELMELSEQFILDCTPNPKQCGGQGGCAGGTAALAYDQLKEYGGAPSEWKYAYISGNGSAGVCHGLPYPAGSNPRTREPSARRPTSRGACRCPPTRSAR